MDFTSAEAKSQRFELLHRIGVALSKERDRDRLVEGILLEAKGLCNADGGTLYLVEGETLRFAMIHTDSLGIAAGGSTGKPIALPAIPLFDGSHAPNLKNVATRAYHDKEAVHIPDAYAATGFDLSGTHKFDAGNQYRSVSLLAIPLLSSQGAVLAVLQLINSRDESGVAIPFHPELQRTVNALAAQAGIALDNQELLEGQRNLLEAFIRLIASAIDAKSPYTGEHCERVPVLAEMIVRSLCNSREGPYAGFTLNDDEWRELRVAAWLHDCGKVTTPVHIMDKATKLEGISDRIQLVETRYEVLTRDVELSYWKAVARGEDEPSARRARDASLGELDDERAFLERANVGGEFLKPEDRERLVQIAERRLRYRDAERPLLDADMLKCLSVPRGTLTDEERIVINGHMVQTLRMLESLPLPGDLKRVPEYAGGHHERMDGKGYPKGLFAGDMSLPARALAIADVFEALTASDRPYKKGKTISDSLAIMGQMKKFNHLDPDLLDHFVRAGLYLDYARKFLKPEQIDPVDEKVVLDVRPQPFELPPKEVRDARWKDFLPEYKTLFR